MDTVNWVSTLANGSPKCTPSERMSFILTSICLSANQTLQKSSVVKRQRGANRFPRGLTKKGRHRGREKKRRFIIRLTASCWCADCCENEFKKMSPPRANNGDSRFYI